MQIQQLIITMPAMINVLQSSMHPVIHLLLSTKTCFNKYYRHQQLLVNMDLPARQMHCPKE